MTKRYFMHKKMVVNNIMSYICMVSMIVAFQIITGLDRLYYISIFLIVLLTTIDILYARHGLYDRVSFCMKGITVYRLMHKKLFYWYQLTKLEVSDLKGIVWIFVVVDQGKGKAPFEFYIKDDGRVLKELCKYKYIMELANEKYKNV